MTGMKTELNLVANQVGEYRGMSANYSGDGFAGMKFSVVAMGDAQFKDWVASSQAFPDSLTWESYQTLRQPHADYGVRYYGEVDTNLQEKIIQSFNHAR
jgi:cytochrome o ubiquinol oxidase subunit 2